MATAVIKRPYSDSYLRGYSDEHVFYEIFMLLGTGEAISNQVSVGGQTVAQARMIANLLVEGFVIHLCNVIDFLYLERPQATDVVAADFYESGGWENIRPAISPTLEAARIRAHKDLAHLTTNRQEGNIVTKEWAAVALLSDLRPVLNLFVVHARQGALSPEIAKIV